MSVMPREIDLTGEPWDNLADIGVDGSEYVRMASSEFGNGVSRTARWTENHPGALN